jgi:hypothetical protein
MKSSHAGLAHIVAQAPIWAGNGATGRVDLLTLKVGQTVSVEGMLLLKANKKPLLKGILKFD